MQNKTSVFTYEDLKLGQTDSFEVEITATMIDEFAEISGDHSPIHTSDSYATTTQFGQRIGHGMLSGIWFSRLIGMHLPGTYALYLSQTFNFHKPFLIGQTVEITGEIVQKIEAVRTIKVKTTVRNKENGEVLVSGEALVKLLA